jgi:hypothetical protein
VYKLGIALWRILLASAIFARAIALLVLEFCAEAFAAIRSALGATISPTALEPKATAGVMRDFQSKGTGVPAMKQLYYMVEKTVDKSKNT